MASPVDYLSEDDLLEVAAGVLDDVLLRDPGLLASAAARPRTTVFGADAYATFAEKVAALMHSLARNLRWWMATRGPRGPRVGRSAC